MILEEGHPLRAHTTLRVGGPARFLARCATEADVREALAFAEAQRLPWRVLGEGSNVLADDAGFAGVVLRMELPGISISSQEDGAVLVTAGAGVSWDALVRAAATRALWGIENLAGIPGTVGAAPVQNIGAYGSEVKDTIASVRVLDTTCGQVRELLSEACAFGYRESTFKHDPALIILSVTFRLARVGEPALAYKDLQQAKTSGVALTTPSEVGEAVRAIRARKFPDLREHGTAGSFFKNPTIAHEVFARLRMQYPELPGFPNEMGVKVPLAFILDRVLGLRGYREGKVWLFAAQPLVLVADAGATASAIDAFANDIARRVHDATGISIEREVRNIFSQNIL